MAEVRKVYKNRPAVPRAWSPSPDRENENVSPDEPPQIVVFEEDNPLERPSLAEEAPELASSQISPRQPSEGVYSDRTAASSRNSTVSKRSAPPAQWKPLPGASGQRLERPASMEHLPGRSSLKEHPPLKQYASTGQMSMGSEKKKRKNIFKKLKFWKKKPKNDSSLDRSTASPSPQSLTVEVKPIPLQTNEYKPVPSDARARQGAAATTLSINTSQKTPSETGSIGRSSSQRTQSTPPPSAGSPAVIETGSIGGSSSARPQKRKAHKLTATPSTASGASVGRKARPKTDPTLDDDERISPNASIRTGTSVNGGNSDRKAAGLGAGAVVVGTQKSGPGSVTRSTASGKPLKGKPSKTGEKEGSIAHSEKTPLMASTDSQFRYRDEKGVGGMWARFNQPPPKRRRTGAIVALAIVGCFVVGALYSATVNLYLTVHLPVAAAPNTTAQVSKNAKGVAVPVAGKNAKDQINEKGKSENAPAKDEKNSKDMKDNTGQPSKNGNAPAKGETDSKDSKDQKGKPDATDAKGGKPSADAKDTKNDKSTDAKDTKTNNAKGAEDHETNFLLVAASSQNDRNGEKPTNETNVKAEKERMNEKTRETEKNSNFKQYYKNKDYKDKGESKGNQQTKDEKDQHQTDKKENEFNATNTEPKAEAKQHKDQEGKPSNSEDHSKTDKNSGANEMKKKNDKNQETDFLLTAASIQDDQKSKNNSNATSAKNEKMDEKNAKDHRKISDDEKRDEEANDKKDKKNDVVAVEKFYIDSKAGNSYNATEANDKKEDKDANTKNEPNQKFAYMGSKDVHTNHFIPTATKYDTSLKTATDEKQEKDIDSKDKKKDKDDKRNQEDSFVIAEAKLNNDKDKKPDNATEKKPTEEQKETSLAAAHAETEKSGDMGKAKNETNVGKESNSTPREEEKGRKEKSENKKPEKMDKKNEEKLEKDEYEKGKSKKEQQIKNYEKYKNEEKKAYEDRKNYRNRRETKKEDKSKSDNGKDNGKDKEESKDATESRNKDVSDKKENHDLTDKDMEANGKAYKYDKNKTEMAPNVENKKEKNTTEDRKTDSLVSASSSQNNHKDEKPANVTSEEHKKVEDIKNKEEPPKEPDSKHAKNWKDDQSSRNDNFDKERDVKRGKNQETDFLIVAATSQNDHNGEKPSSNITSNKREKNETKKEEFKTEKRPEKDIYFKEKEKTPESDRNKESKSSKDTGREDDKKTKEHPIDEKESQAKKNMDQGKKKENLETDFLLTSANIQNDQQREKLSNETNAEPKKEKENEKTETKKKEQNEKDKNNTKNKNNFEESKKEKKKGDDQPTFFLADAEKVEKPQSDDKNKKEPTPNDANKKAKDSPAEDKGKPEKGASADAKGKDENKPADDKGKTEKGATADKGKDENVSSKDKNEDVRKPGSTGPVRIRRRPNNTVCDESCQVNMTETQWAFIDHAAPAIIFVLAPIIGFLVEFTPRLFLLVGLFLLGGSYIGYGCIYLISSTTVYFNVSITLRVIQALGTSAFLVAIFAMLAFECSGNLAMVTAMALGSLFAGFTLGPAIFYGFLQVSAEYDIGGWILGGIAVILSIICCPCVNVVNGNVSEKWLGKSPSMFSSIFLWFMALVSIVTGMSASFYACRVFKTVMEVSTSPIYISLVYSGFVVILLIALFIFGAMMIVRTSAAWTFIMIGLGLTAVGYFVAGPIPVSEFNEHVWTTGAATGILAVGLGMTLATLYSGMLDAANKAGRPESLKLNAHVAGVFIACLFLGVFVASIMTDYALPVLGYRWLTTLIGCLNLFFVFVGAAYKGWKVFCKKKQHFGDDYAAGSVVPPLMSYGSISGAGNSSTKQIKQVI